ncbi:MAG: flagellar basal body rod protein FlgC [Phycisphaerales bacterium]|nr:flagellar basal body rod protein FlgC [Phycisphaerales bacterium]
MFESLDIGASGLVAQRQRMETIAQNLANANTTRNARGEISPYRRRFVVFQPARDKSGAAGVRVGRIGLDQSPFRREYRPDHPDAVKQGPDKGYVMMPNIDMATEMVNAIEASRAYEANITMMETSKAMFNASLRLLV